MVHPLDNSTSGTITHLLSRIDAGDQAAIEQLFAQVYKQLKHIARRNIRQPDDEDLLQTTAIVNEACLRLSGNGFDITLRNRRHLFAAVNRAVQHVLIDYARKRAAQKRQADRDPVLETALQRYEDACGGQLIDLQDAIDSLRETHSRAAEIVDARFWGGLSVQETADLLDISADTVKRDWRFTRAYLKCRLEA
jgi:RNA polymerase sigma factor (TIGR02999 family)